MEIINKIKSDLLNGNNNKLIIQSYALLLSSAMIMSLVSFIIAGYFGLIVSILMLIYLYNNYQCLYLKRYKLVEQDH